MRLERRDRLVLAEAFLSRVIRRRDLIGLGHFSSIGRCNARLLALKGGGYLVARTELGGVSMSAPIYMCTARGVRIAAEESGIAPEEAIETHRMGLRDLAVRHALRCCDLRLQFLRDSRSESGIDLSRWSHEILCHHEFSTEWGNRIVMKPDGLAVLQCGHREHFLFIEADLGNAALPKMREKFSRYDRYAASGAFSEAYGADGFAVLTVTTDERRMQNLLAIAQGPQYLFSTWRRLEAQSLYGNSLASGDGSFNSMRYWMEGTVR